MFTASHVCYLNRHKIVRFWKLRHKHRGQRWLSLNVSACGALFIKWLQLKVKTASISNNTVKCCFTLNLNEKMLCSLASRAPLWSQMVKCFCLHEQRRLCPQRFYGCNGARAVMGYWRSEWGFSISTLYCGLGQSHLKLCKSLQAVVTWSQC